MLLHVVYRLMCIAISALPWAGGSCQAPYVGNPSPLSSQLNYGGRHSQAHGCGYITLMLPKVLSAISLWLLRQAVTTISSCQLYRH
jgi:hypothetical protein